MSTTDKAGEFGKDLKAEPMNALVCWGVAEGGGRGQVTYARRLLEGLIGALRRVRSLQPVKPLPAVGPRGI